MAESMSYGEMKRAVHRMLDEMAEEHERAMADAELAAAPTEAQLEEWGYVKLPVDADGVPVHVGDTLDGYGKIVEMRYGRGGWVLIGIWKEDA